MFEQIQKLKQTKAKLTANFEEHQKEYKTEVKRIDRAIKNFEKGIDELKGNVVRTAPQKKYSEIEKILSETGPLHLKQLCEKLNERGIPMQYQSLSGLMQLYAKANKKFFKVSPATYGLIEAESVVKPEVPSAPEISAEPHNTNTANTSSKKKPSNKPIANVQTISDANGGNDSENVPAKTVAEKRTIVYEFEEIEAGEINDEE